MMIARIFPRKTSMTPSDELVFFDIPGLFPPEVDEVHVSVTWDEDIPKAEKLFRAWQEVASTKIGGPAISSGGDFIPGRYLKEGMVITSRGCPNTCWFCRVWRMDGKIKELPITDGYNVLDDNLLACNEQHIEKVFYMLQNQKMPIIFSGGLDVRFISDKVIELLNSIKVNQIYLAYDTEDDFEPLRLAANKLTMAGYERHKLYCYVLVGYVGDTFELAEERLNFVASLNITPKAMLWNENRNIEWKRFQREYYRNELLYGKYKQYWKTA